MERIETYLHSAERKTKDIFLKCLRKALNKIDKSSLGFVGIIGSYATKDYSHDIDVLIFPAKRAKIGEAIKAVTELYDEVDKLLKKEHERFYVAISPKMIMQEMIYYLASLEEGGVGLIPVHSLFFTDYKSFISINPKDFLKQIKKNLITIYGDFNVIKELPELPQKKLEPYFLIIDFEMNARIRTFPRHVIRSSAESLFSYLKHKYNIKIKNTNLYNLKDIEKQFVGILKILDKQNYSN